MKQRTIPTTILAISIALLMHSGCKKTEVISYQVTANEAQVDGLIPVTSIGFGKNAETATRQAEMNAFRAVLFRGIAGTSASKALIGTSEGEILSKHSSYFNQLFEGERYRTFVTSSTMLNEERVKRNTRSTVDLTMNIDALRRDLESAGIIRRFGL